MAEKDPNKLYNGIKTLQDDLESIRSLVDQIVENSKTLMNDANTFGGVIAKVFKEQMAKYFIPGVQGIAEPIDNLVTGDRVPGSLKDLTIFLDSVPLAMIRQEPSVTELASPVVPKNVNLDTPAGKVTSEVDEIPQNQSYQTEEAPIEESKKKPSVEDNRKRFAESRLPYMSDEWIERWKSSPKGKMEGDWFKNRVYGMKKGYNPFEDTANVNKPWNGRGNEYDAKDLLKKFGRVYVNGDTNSILDPYYTSSLLKTWGEPNTLDVDSDYFPPAKDLPAIQMQATSDVKRYHRGEIDLEELHRRLANLFGSKEEAAVWLADNDEEIKSKMFESEDDEPGIWQILRKSGIGSSLGEDVANIEPQVVCEFDCKESAEERRKELESCVLPEEKELLGTSYEIHKVPLNKED